MFSSWGSDCRATSFTQFMEAALTDEACFLFKKDTKLSAVVAHVR